MDTKELEKQTKLKQKYLKYYDAEKSKGKTPMTWSKWKQKHDSSKMGGSRQMKEQMSGLSSGDYKAIMDTFGKKKK